MASDPLLPSEQVSRHHSVYFSITPSHRPVITRHSSAFNLRYVRPPFVFPVRVGAAAEKWRRSSRLRPVLKLLRAAHRIGKGGTLADSKSVGLEFGRLH